MKRYLRPVIGVICLIVGAVLFILPIPIGILILGLGVILLAPRIPAFKKAIKWVENRSAFVRLMMKKMKRYVDE